MTYRDALNAGYRNADVTYELGYVSRRLDTDTAPVLKAGGSRKGQLYVLLPCRHSSRFCFRQYLTR